MALQLELTIGIDTFSTAYAKIISQSSDNNGDKTNITYHVSAWASKAHKDAGMSQIDTDRYEVMKVDLVTADFAGLYTRLKSQEKYVNGVDV